MYVSIKMENDRKNVHAFLSQTCLFMLCTHSSDENEAEENTDTSSNENESDSESKNDEGGEDKFL